MSAAGQRVAVVGGGMLGLVLALRLAQAGRDVQVLEAAPVAGGLASPWQLGDVTWDRYYHVIAGRDAALLGLLDELGLGPAIRWRATRTNFYDGRRLHPLDNAWDYVRLPGLGLVDKARLAFTVLKAARVADPTRLEAFGAQEWLERQGGRRNWTGLWRPLLRAKLGSNAEHASASYIVSVIQRFYGAREGHRKTERFATVAGGYRQVLDALLGRLQQAGVTVRTACPVQRVQRGDDGLWHVDAAGRRLGGFDRIVLTCATPLAADLCPQLPAAQAAAWRSLRYQGVVCASLLLSRPLGGAYLTYLTDESLPFTTVIEMSTLVEPARLGGHHLAYLPRYVPSDDPIFDEDDAAISHRFRTGLRRLFPDLRDEQVLAERIARTRQVLAVATRHHSARVPPMDTGLPGLHLVCSAQIVDAALSVDDTVRLAERAARELLAA